MQIKVDGFSPDKSCVDYRSYVYRIDPNIDEKNFVKLRESLSNLGTAERERMGVVYVRGPWGFFVIPSFGFPNLKVSFFHDTPEYECVEVMQTIGKIFLQPDLVNEQGDFHE